MLGFLSGTAVLLLQTIGGDEMSVAILSMLYHHPELTRNNRHQISNHLPKLQNKLSNSAYKAAWEKGKELNIDKVVALLGTAWR
jgi:hypothetical protein